MEKYHALGTIACHTFWVWQLKAVERYGVFFQGQKITPPSAMLSWVLAAMLGEKGYKSSLHPSEAVAVGGVGRQPADTATRPLPTGIVRTAGRPHPVGLRALRKDPVLNYSLY